MKKILVLHGPNLNLLGLREPDLYGHQSLTDINEQLKHQAAAAGFELQSYQSNSEAELIHAIHEASTQQVDYLIVNPAGFTHTSIVLRDALIAVKIPFIEVHISNIYAREAFRQHSYFSDIALGVISGFGPTGYLLALNAIQSINVTAHAVPTSRGLSAGSSDMAGSLDSAEKPRNVGADFRSEQVTHQLNKRET